MHVPGIDILRESTREILTCKQVSSVARQLGRRRILSELYGASGWDFTFEAEKWVGDWQIALGVNLRCQHLAWYTMARCAKRDYPPDFNYQSTAWKHHKPTEDYFARLSYMTSLGEAEREVLVLHPIESVWAGRAFASEERGGRLEESLETVMRALLETHHDFDLGEEDIISRRASVEGSCLRVERALYRAVVVPPAVTWRASTVELLERLVDSGGNVLFAGPPAGRIDCSPSKRLAALSGRKRVSVVECEKAALAEALDSAGVRSVRLADARDGEEAASVLCQRRSAEGRTILFLANTDREKGRELDVTVERASGGVEDWDLWTGEVRPLPARSDEARVTFRAMLGPTGSMLLVVRPEARPAFPAGTRLKDAGRARLRRKWSFSRDEPNSRVLDRCSYRLDDEPFSAEKPVRDVENEVRPRLGLPPNGNRDVQLWRLYREPRDTGRTLELCFEFKARQKPSKDLWLVLERPREFEIELNGEKVPSKPKGWFIDRAFERVDIKGRVRKGANELLMRTVMRTTTGIEAVYLAGDFGVDAKTLALTAEPKELSSGDWTKQGYAQYPGSMTLRQKVRLEKKGERFFLSLSRRAVHATCLFVRVNGRDAGLVPWPPWEIEVTDLVRSGSNEIEIEVVGSRRNLLGPLHLKEARPAWVGPEQFEPASDAYSEGYRLVPYGLVGDVFVVRRKEVPS
jgi:hypothetical protein